MATLKVLIVDDEPGIRSGINRILKNFTVGFPFMEEDFDFEMIEAGSGEEAIEWINRQVPDIVLLDNKLPGIDGIEVLEYINEKQIESLVMMITSYASLDLAVKATQNGAYNFVPKPFTPQELKSAMENITKHLYLRRMTRQMSNGQGKQARNRFISVLSHELKSPVNAIDGYLKMMKDKQLGENLDDYMLMIDRCMERLNGMRNLIMDLLDLTKIESGKNIRELRNIDLADTARKAVYSVEAYAMQRKVRLNVNLPESLYFIADSNEMDSIFNNLLSNAVKYNKPDGGMVNLDLRKEGDKIIITVEDTGIGMSEEDVSKLFNEFVRIKSEKTKGISGSGLGLSIVRKIVEEYHGNIKVKSETDKGSIFTVELPVKS
ncbi:MAG TPA: ATP-binding protein [Bacteroidia bacterium]|nr:ATP-binding protein [Bacteroidia bacterium]HRS58896.1 ATP-binding protein [Bacteroidia bacterium]HRU67393.1 ATP-binding protein [Bacteroidia bacterium]